MDMKQCTKCKKEYPATADYFNRNKACRDGLHTRCKTCKQKQNRQWWADNQSEISERRKEQYATDEENRRKNLERSKQWRDENHEEVLQKKRAYYQQNREHDLAKSREWREKHPEYRKAYDREYAMKHRNRIRRYKEEWRVKNIEHVNKHRRYKYQQDPTSRMVSNLRREARKQNLPDTMTEVDYKFMMRYWNGACAITGAKDDLQIDHWIPLASEDCPGTVPTNMIPLSTSLNASKQDSQPFEWLVWKFGEDKAGEIVARIETYFEVVERVFG